MESLLNCDFCHQKFNTTDRIPYGLNPCLHLACEPCTLKLKQEGNLCQKNHESPVEIKEFLIHTSILEKLKSNFGIIIYCSKHPDKVADLFNKEKNIFICVKCAIIETNKNALIDQSQELYMKQGELLCNYAEQLEKKLQTIKAIGNGMFKRTISFSGDEMYPKIKEVIKCIKGFDIDIDAQVFRVYNQGLSENLLINISIICQEKVEYAKKLVEWVDQKYEWGSLLYRGTMHGFEAKQFHDKCDGKGPTLTLVQTTENFFFGGFTALSWHSPLSGKYEQDGEAFIFSLTHSTKHPVKQDQLQYSIRCYSKLLSKMDQLSLANFIYCSQLSIALHMQGVHTQQCGPEHIGLPPEPLPNEDLQKAPLISCCLPTMQWSGMDSRQESKITHTLPFPIVPNELEFLFRILNSGSIYFVRRCISVVLKESIMDIGSNLDFTKSIDSFSQFCKSGGHLQILREIQNSKMYK